MTWTTPRSTLAAALAAALLGGGGTAPAAAQGEITGVIVCGQQRCGTVPELDAELASTLTRDPGRPVRGGAAFYDVSVVSRAPSGRRTTGPVLRYVPSLRVVRATTPGGAVTWHATGKDLASVLDRAARVGTPRPAPQLGRPAAEIAATTAAERRRIEVGTASAARPGPADEDASISGWVATAAVGGAIGVLVLFVLAGRRSASPTTRPPRRARGGRDTPGP